MKVLTDSMTIWQNSAVAKALQQSLKVETTSLTVDLLLDPRVYRLPFVLKPCE